MKKFFYGAIVVIIAVFGYFSLATPTQASTSTDTIKPATKSATTSISTDPKYNVSAIEKNADNLDPKVLKLALKAYDKAREQGLDDKQILTIIDYSMPSTEKRLWVIDLANKEVTFNTLVAHAQNSGDNNSTRFSNIVNSKETSIGVFLTDDTYYGHKGLSLRMKGLEPGFNDNAYKRAVVFHGAEYVSEDFINRYGRLGRSWGCPALSLEDYKPVINKIKDGTLVFAYYPDKKWLNNSSFVA